MRWLTALHVLAGALASSLFGMAEGDAASVERLLRQNPPPTPSSTSLTAGVAPAAVSSVDAPDSLVAVNNPRLRSSTSSRQPLGPASFPAHPADLAPAMPSFPKMQLLPNTADATLAPAPTLTGTLFSREYEVHIPGAAPPVVVTSTDVEWGSKLQEFGLQPAATETATVPLQQVQPWSWEPSYFPQGVELEKRPLQVVANPNSWDTATMASEDRPPPGWTPEQGGWWAGALEFPRDIEPL